MERREEKGAKTVNMASASYLKIFQEDTGMMDEAYGRPEQTKIK